MIYLVEFTRIGRHLDVRDLETPARDREDLAERVRRYAQPKLASRSIEVWVDLVAGVGYITAGSRPAGVFTIKERGAES